MSPAAPATAPEAAPMVRFDKVTKSYGSFVVLDQLELDIAAGEKVAIIGPSGSGKTTVLRMLMTLERINGGVIWVDGEPLTSMPRNGGVVPAAPRHLRRMRGRLGRGFPDSSPVPPTAALENAMAAACTAPRLSEVDAAARAGPL